MDVEVKCTVRNLEALRKQIIATLMPKVVKVVQAQVDLYLQDLEAHMGSIHGAANYTGSGLNWQALDEGTLDDGPKYWYKTGKAKQSISVNIQTSDSGIKAFVGIAENAPGYQEALWNELGFTPRNGDTLVRRPLFFPLAEEHKAALNSKLQEALGKQSLVVEI